MAGDTQAGFGLLGQYYDNTDLTSLVATQIDPSLNFDWKASSPLATIGVDGFSARWSGKIEAKYTERYSFIVNADHRFRFWVNGQKLMDRNISSISIDQSAAIDLVAGRRYDIQIEYIGSAGDASLKLAWSSPSQERQVIPSSQLFPSERGGLSVERWNNIQGVNVSDLTSNANYLAPPSLVTSISSLATMPNSGDQYGERLSGFLYPPTTGVYTFYIAGDDSAELWLGNSDDTASLRLVATVPSLTLPNEWSKFPQQKSLPISLVAGQYYSIQILHKESLGPDHLSVGWTQPGLNAVSAIAGEFLSPVLPVVSVSAEQPTLIENSSVPAKISFLRSGSSLVNPLVVNYLTRGTATAGSDYVALTGTITIPAGKAFVSLDIKAISDSLIEGDESIFFELRDGTGYEVDRLSQRTTQLIIQDNVPVPLGGRSVLTGNNLANFTSFGGVFTTEYDSIYGSVIQAKITSNQTSPSLSQIRQTINVPVEVGDVLFTDFMVRSLGTPGKITTVFESNSSPYTKSLEKAISVTSNWTKVQIPFEAVARYQGSEANFGFYLGGLTQTLQFAFLRLLDYGPSPDLKPDYGLFLNNIGGTFGQMKTESSEGLPFSQVFQVDTKYTPVSDEYWRLQAVARNALPVGNATKMRVEFWARGLTGTLPRIALTLGEAFGSYVSLYESLISLTSVWEKYSFEVTTQKSYLTDTIQVTFNVGFAPQAVQIGGLIWKRLGNSVDSKSLPSQLPAVTYAGRSGTDAWRSEAEARIADLRMGNLTVNVTDANGNPVDGAVVNIRQRKADFKFGTAISSLDNQLSPTAGEDAIKYQAEIKRLFNTVVVENDLKWTNFSNNRQQGIDTVTWALNNGLYVRGHSIVWPSRDNIPSSVWSQYDSILASLGTTSAATYLRNTVTARLNDAVSTFQGKIKEWDVTNELFDNHDVMDILGNSVVLDWYRLFRQKDLTGKRVFNDFDIFSNNGTNKDHRANFDSWLNQLKVENLVDVIGEQSHYIDSILTDIPILGQLLNTYRTAFNLPIEITEFDFNTTDEQLQADYLRDYMTMAFSQSNVTEFVQWGFWSRSHWRPDAALYRDDFSIKQNGQAYEDLVFGEWWTDTRGTTRLGNYDTRAFLGDYDVVVTLNGQIVSTTTQVRTGSSTLKIHLPGVRIYPSTLSVTEGGPSNSYTLVLTTPPTANVLVSLTSNTQLQVTPSTITFSPSTWNVPQAIAISAVYDSIVEGTQLVLVTHRVSSSDPRFNAVMVPTAKITILDNLAPTSITISQSSITENNSVNAVVGLLTANDKNDKPSDLKFTLVSGPGSDNNSAFNILGNQLRATGVFDFEDKASYAIRIRATDKGGLYVDRLAIISILDAPENATIVSRNLFYRGSAFDNTPNSQAAIDLSKTALLNGQSTRANYSNYVMGINGIIIDIAGLASNSITINDFQFRIGNSNTPSIWTTLPTSAFVAGQPITVLPGQGLNGSTRVKLNFANNVIQKTWLQVTVLANAKTGLASSDVFYFGSAPGDTIQSGTSVSITSEDVTAIQAAISSAIAPVTRNEDINKDNRITTVDADLATQLLSATSILNLIRV